MGFVEFVTIASFLGSLLFLLIMAQVQYQDKFYKYAIENKSKSVQTLLIASGFYFIAGCISLFVWIHETKKANRQKEQEEINEIPEEAIN